MFWHFQTALVAPVSSTPTIKERIDKLRADFAGCRSLALADISSGTVLYTSSATRQPQERLDALCAAAAGLLGKDAHTAPSDQSGGPRATVHGLNEQILFVGAPFAGSEALLAICDLDLDGDRLMDQCAALLTPEAPDSDLAATSQGVPDGR